MRPNRHSLTTLATALAISAIAMGAYLAIQQSERLGANEPQTQLAEDAALALGAAGTIDEVIPSTPAPRDVGRSLGPMLIYLDDAGRPVASTGTLDGAVPVPPRGVLDEVRTRGEERVTWAPRRNVRLASVIRRVGGVHPGFVVAARSLRETESRIDTIGRLLLLAWLAALVALFAPMLLSMLPPLPPLPALGRLTPSRDAARAHATT